MKDEKYLHLGDLELQIMNIIWEKNRPCAVSEIHEILYPESKRAYTTIMTVMGNLYKKGVLNRTKSGNAYLYKAIMEKDDIASDAIKKITNSFFKNNITDFINCFLKTRNSLNRDELEEIKKKVEEFESELEEE